jgi:hypothetical protein
MGKELSNLPNSESKYSFFKKEESAPKIEKVEKELKNPVESSVAEKENMQQLDSPSERVCSN